MLASCFLLHLKFKPIFIVSVSVTKRVISVFHEVIVNIDMVCCCFELPGLAMAGGYYLIYICFIKTKVYRTFANFTSFCFCSAPLLPWRWYLPFKAVFGFSWASVRYPSWKAAFVAFWVVHPVDTLGLNAWCTLCALHKLIVSAVRNDCSTERLSGVMLKNWSK